MNNTIPVKFLKSMKFIERVAYMIIVSVESTELWI